MKNLKTRSIGARISDETFDWIIEKMKDNGATFSHAISMILDDAMEREKAKKKK